MGSWIRIRVVIKVESLIQVRIKVKSMILIQIRIKMKKLEALEGLFLALEGQNLEKSVRIWIRIKLKGRIRIRIKVKSRIRIRIGSATISRKQRKFALAKENELFPRPAVFVKL